MFKFIAIISFVTLGILFNGSAFAQESSSEIEIIRAGDTGGLIQLGKKFYLVDTGDESVEAIVASYQDVDMSEADVVFQRAGSNGESLVMVGKKFYLLNDGSEEARKIVENPMEEAGELVFYTSLNSNKGLVKKGFRYYVIELEELPTNGTEVFNSDRNTEFPGMVVASTTNDPNIGVIVK